MAILHVDFFSRALNRGAQMDVILPDARGNAQKPWKTLYLLHGMTDDCTAWQRWTSIERYAEEYGIAVIMPDARLSWFVMKDDVLFGSAKASAGEKNSNAGKGIAWAIGLAILAAAIYAIVSTGGFGSAWNKMKRGVSEITGGLFRKKD